MKHPVFISMTNPEHLIEKLLSLAAIYMPKIALTLLTLIIGFWLANRMRVWIRKLLERRKVNPNVIPFMGSLISILIKIMVLISAAAKFGIETTSFVALLGGAGLAVGLALQGNLSNFASGVMILAFKPYQIGDSVIIAGYTGVVTEILIFNTVLRTADNRRVIIPNNSITTSPITNISGNGELRVELNFKVPRQKDMGTVKNIILAACSQNEKIHPSPAPSVSLNSEDWAITVYTVRVWCAAGDTDEVSGYLNEEIKCRLAAL
ncbi:MAG: mechanosensitive ion channel [Leadbetterella sp.]|nr:mechanosensitive ion channel [Leadbetterella sp.]